MRAGIGYSEKVINVATREPAHDSYKRLSLLNTGAFSIFNHELLSIIINKPGLDSYNF